MKLAVIGDPVAHSRSPELHRQFLRKAGINGTYEAIRVRAGEAVAAIERMRADGYTGCNITSPLKEEVVAACDVLEPTARKAGAVNTILFDDRIVGENTDGIGALGAIAELLGESIGSRRVVVLGTGPTARATFTQANADGVAIAVWGRNPDKVRALCKHYQISSWVPHGDTDVIFSTLPPNAALPPDVIDALRDAPLVIDANYGDRAMLGKQIGRTIPDGSLMLERQARASFDFWAG